MHTIENMVPGMPEGNSFWPVFATGTSKPMDPSLLMGIVLLIVLILGMVIYLVMFRKSARRPQPRQRPYYIPDGRVRDVPETVSRKPVTFDDVDDDEHGDIGAHDGDAEELPMMGEPRGTQAVRGPGTSMERGKLHDELAQEEDELLREEYESDLPEEEPVEVYESAAGDEEPIDTDDDVTEELPMAEESIVEEPIPSSYEHAGAPLPRDTGFGEDDELEDIDAVGLESDGVEVAEAMDAPVAGTDPEMTIDDLPGGEDEGIETLDMDLPKKDVVSGPLADMLLQKSIERSLKEDKALATKAVATASPAAKPASATAAAKEGKPVAGPSWSDGKPNYSQPLKEVETPPEEPKDDEREGPSLAAQLLAEKARQGRERMNEKFPSQKGAAATPGADGKKSIDDKKREDKRKMEDARRRDEERRKEAELKKDEQRKKDEEIKRDADFKNDEERKRKEDEARKAAQKKKDDEASKKAEEERRRKQDAEKKKEDERLKEEARKADEERKLREARRRDEESRREAEKKQNKDATIDDVLSRIGINK